MMASAPAVKAPAAPAAGGQALGAAGFAGAPPPQPAARAWEPQAKWTLLLDADLLEIVEGPFSDIMRRLAVEHGVEAWHSASGVHVQGAAHAVAMLREQLFNALVAHCTLAEDAEKAPAGVQATSASTAITVIEPTPQVPAWTPQMAFPAAYAATSMVPQYGPTLSTVAAMSPMVHDFSTAVGFYDGGAYDSAVGGPTEELVHFQQQIPHSLVGLVIGVKGASIHAVELASACHLSLDRGYVYMDSMTGVPYVLLHIHGVRSGAMQAVNMVAQILQRHMSTLAVPLGGQQMPVLTQHAWGASMPAEAFLQDVLPPEEAEEAQCEDVITRVLCDERTEEEPPVDHTPLLATLTAPKTPGGSRAGRSYAQRRRRLLVTPVSTPDFSSSPV